VLPPVVQPDVWYSYNPSDTLFPELFENAVGGNGIGPMAGPAYQFESGNPSQFKWPSYYNGQPLFYEWSRDYVKEMRLNKPNGGRLTDIRQVNIPQAPTFIVPGTDDHPVDNPMDMEFGPDGALYTIQYGDGFFSLNPDAKLTKINFVRGNRSPVPKVAAAGQPDPNVPLELLLTENPTVQFSSAGTADPDGDRLTYAWDFNADGDATLTVTDRSGRKASASVPIIVGNKTPVVTLTTSPAPGEPFQFGQQVSYTVEVTDDAPVDCSKVRVTYILGHDQHGHPLTSSLGCSGTITTTAPGHGGATNLRAVFNASYTDAPEEEGVPLLTGSDEVVIPPTG
jgi:cytochrome c